MVPLLPPTFPLGSLSAKNAHFQLRSLQRNPPSLIFPSPALSLGSSCSCRVLPKPQHPALPVLKPPSMAARFEWELLQALGTMWESSFSRKYALSAALPLTRLLRRPGLRAALRGAGKPGSVGGTPCPTDGEGTCEVRQLLGH